MNIMIIIILFAFLFSPSTLTLTLTHNQNISTTLSSEETYWASNVVGQMPRVIQERLPRLTTGQATFYRELIANKTLCRLANLVCQQTAAIHPTSFQYSMQIYTNPSSRARAHDHVNTSNTFFHSNQLEVGKDIWVTLERTRRQPKSFLPKSLKFPLAYGAISELLLSPTEAMKDSLRKAIDVCNGAPIKGEVKKCVTSVEELVEFPRSLIGGGKVSAITSHMNTDHSAFFRIRKIKIFRQNLAVACHEMAVPFATFFCHRLQATVVQEVEFSSGEAALAVCHFDTSGWAPDHPAFSDLRAAPGEGEACHFLNNYDIAWI